MTRPERSLDLDKEIVMEYINITTNKKKKKTYDSTMYLKDRDAFDKWFSCVFFFILEDTINFD